MKSGDVSTIRDLAVNSKLNSEATAHGQWIRTLGERNPESPVGAIRDIVNVREKTAKARVKNIDQTKQGEVGNIKAHIKKAMPSVSTWDQFIQSIRC